MCQPGEGEGDGDSITGSRMTSQMLMTEALIDTGVQKYNASAAGTLLLRNAITTMLCISSNPTGMARDVFAGCLEHFVVPGSDTGGFMPG